MAISRRDLLSTATALAATWPLAKSTFASSGAGKEVPSCKRLASERRVISRIGAERAVNLHAEMARLVWEGGGRVLPGWGATGCLFTSHRLGATAVNPLEYDLPISRAANPLRQRAQINLMLAVNQRGADILATQRIAGPDAEAISIQVVANDWVTTQSRSLKGLIRYLTPRATEEWAAIVALFRPGPILRGMPEQYRDGEADAELLDLLPDAEQILSKTRGIPLYQEQLTRLVSLASGIDEFQADVVRMDIGKGLKSSATMDSFLRSLAEKGWSPGRSNQLLEVLRDRYSATFCQAHALAVAMALQEA